MRRFVRSASLLVLCLVGCGEHPGVLSPDRGKAPSPDSQPRSAYVAVNDSSSVGRAGGGGAPGPAGAGRPNKNPWA